MTPEQAFSHVLLQLRQEANVTQEQLAFDANLDRTYISLLERGRRQPTLRSMLQLSAAFHLSPTSLMNLVERVLDEGRTN